MAPDNNNWLSFSLSSVELLNTAAAAASQSPIMHSSPSDSHHFYSFADNFYAAGWSDPKPQGVYPETGDDAELKDHGGGSGESTSIFAGYMQPPPKLEDFFAGGESTGAQDSSLTHLYDPAHHRPAFFAAAAADHHELKNLTGFQAFSAASGDDAAFAAPTQSPVEPGNDMVPYSRCQVPPETPSNGLTLAVNNNRNTSCAENNDGAAIVSGDSDGFKKMADTFGQRTSIYRGVTRHRWTGRYEAHLWDNSCRREGQARKGRQVYLGGYDKEEKAARAYDLAALKYWGPTASTNFPMSSYSRELEEMKHVTRQEFIASLRRKSSGFSRGASIYRGVTRHHQQGRWQARIGRVAGNKDLYLGTFATEEEAAEAYDIAAIKFRGVNAVTNFEMSRYDVEAITKSPLPIGETAKRLRLSLESEGKLPLQQGCSRSSSNISFSALQPSSTIPCAVPLIATAPFLHQNLIQQLHPGNYGAEDPTMVTPVSMMPSPPEFYIWPHQSQ